MDWRSRGSCVGDDPRRWDIENLPEGREMEAAADLCADCPVMVACARDALRLVDNSQVYNRLAREWNAIHGEDEGFAAREEEPFFIALQEGVVRAGVPMVDYTCVEALTTIAGDRKVVDGLCTECGRTLWKSTTPRRDRFEGSVNLRSRGMCQRCEGEAPPAERPSAMNDVVRLRREGMRINAIAAELGIHRCTVSVNLAKARSLGIET